MLVCDFYDITEDFSNTGQCVPVHTWRQCGAKVEKVVLFLGSLTIGYSSWLYKAFPRLQFSMRLLGLDVLPKISSRTSLKCQPLLVCDFYNVLEDFSNTGQCLRVHTWRQCGAKVEKWVLFLGSLTIGYSFWLYMAFPRLQFSLWHLWLDILPKISSRTPL